MLKIRHSLKLQVLKKNINFLILILLVSFLIGNIFGLNSKILLFNDPGLLFFLFPLVFEILNNLIGVLIKKNSNKTLYYTIISIRRGFFLGIFIEAFKVGS